MRFEKEYEHRDRKQVIVNKEFGYFLFQSFRHLDTHEFIRIMEMDQTQGTAISEGGRKPPLSLLKEQGFVPLQFLEEKKVISKKGYAKLVFPHSPMIKAAVYNVIERLIVTAGQVNIQVQVLTETNKV